MAWRQQSPRVTIPQGPRGYRGERGPAGPPGPPGPSGDAVIFYRHVQGAPSAEWHVQHNLGYRPGGITAFDSAHIQRDGTVTHLDDNSFVVTFVAGGVPVAFSGELYAS